MTDIYSLPPHSLSIYLSAFLNFIKPHGFSHQNSLCHVADLWFIMSYNETGCSSQIQWNHFQATKPPYLLNLCVSLQLMGFLFKADSERNPTTLAATLWEKTVCKWTYYIFSRWRNNARLQKEQSTVMVPVMADACTWSAGAFNVEGNWWDAYMLNVDFFFFLWMLTVEIVRLGWQTRVQRL